MEVVQCGPHDLCDIADLRPGDARHRVEIHAKLVGMIQVVITHRMRMELEACQIRHPDERRSFARNHLFCRAT